MIGIGRMGAAMARTLRAAGFDLVVWNRDGAKAEAVAADTDAEVAASPAQAAAGASVVLSSLADDAALQRVYLGPDGVVEGLTAGSVVIDTSTVDPGTIHEVGAAVDAKGATFLDAPVSGSVSTVEQGALTIMVGGDAADIERVQPVLDALAARVIHVGERGAGSAAKLAVNSLVHGLNIALAEALVLAERAGVDRAVAYEVFASGAGGAPFVQYKRAAYENPEDAVVAFSLDLVDKDLDLITSLAKRVGAPLDQGEVTRSIVRRAIDSGLGDADLSAVAVYLRSQTSE